MKKLWVLFVGGVGLVGGVMMSQTIITTSTPPGIEVIRIPMSPTAMDLEFVIERDDDGNVTKIHRFILWSDGRVSFPNIPYYAQLVFSCRDCPKVPNSCPADIDGDGIVSVLDLIILNAELGTTCPTLP